jgi:hypothetical protein
MLTKGAVCSLVSIKSQIPAHPFVAVKTGVNSGLATGSLALVAGCRCGVYNLLNCGGVESDFIGATEAWPCASLIPAEKSFWLHALVCGVQETLSCFFIWRLHMGVYGRLLPGKSFVIVEIGRFKGRNAHLFQFPWDLDSYDVQSKMDTIAVMR